MQTVLPREEEVEAIFSQILASPDSCKKLMDVFYDAMDDNHLLESDDPKHFSKVLFYAYQNGDVTALLLKLCGKSMFDLLRDAYLIPKKFHGKAGMNPVLPVESIVNLKKFIRIMNVRLVLNFILPMDMISFVPMLATAR